MLTDFTFAHSYASFNSSTLCMYMLWFEGVWPQPVTAVIKELGVPMGKLRTSLKEKKNILTSSVSPLVPVWSVYTGLKNCTVVKSFLVFIDNFFFCVCL